MKRIVFLLLTATVFSFLPAFEWPVSQISPVSLFGQKTESSIECGIRLQNRQLVRSAGNGTLIMILEKGNPMTNFPSTLGNAAIIAHEEGLVSIYGNLESHDHLENRTTIETGSILGESGTSACAPEGTLFFQVIDLLKGRYLNPLLVLPSLEDTRKPSIKTATLTADNGRVHQLATIKSLRQGKYRLHSEISDTVDDGRTELAPFRVTVILNGREYTTISFEVIRNESGTLFLGTGNHDINTVYDEAGQLYLGNISLPRGKNDISIIARDIVGNERSVNYSITTD